MQVKWKGYEDPADQTLEPEENLLSSPHFAFIPCCLQWPISNRVHSTRDGAQDAVSEYFELLGGRPEKSTKKRKSLGTAASSTPNQTPAKKARKSLGSTNGTPDTEAGGPDWLPKSKNWDKEVHKVETIIRESNDNLYALLHWKNDKKSKVSIQQCYDKCPQKVMVIFPKKSID